MIIVIVMVVVVIIVIVYSASGIVTGPTKIAAHTRVFMLIVILIIVRIRVMTEAANWGVSADALAAIIVAVIMMPMTKFVIIAVIVFIHFTIVVVIFRILSVVGRKRARITTPGTRP